MHVHCQINKAKLIEKVIALVLWSDENMLKIMGEIKT